MKTGYSKICITPPLGTMMCGYYEKRRSRGVLDDLYATAVSFDDGERRALILAVDVCEFSNAQTDEIRRRVSVATGIDVEAIFVNCSHTHTGPVVGEDLDGEPTDPVYDGHLFDLLTSVARESLQDMRESRFYVGEGRAEGISFPRRYRMKSGKVQTNPGVNNPDIDHALGTANDTVKFLKIERKNAENVVFVNFGTHADTVGGEFISGDWPNFVNETVEKVFENTRCVFLTGAQGDVNHINTAPTAGDRLGLDYDTFDGVPRGYEHAKHMGRKVAAAVIAGLDKAEPISSDKISYVSKKITIPSNRENGKLDEARRILQLHNEGRDRELPYERMELTTVVAEANRICELEHGPDSFDFTLGALKLGDLVITAMPGECFVEIGRRIEASYTDGAIMVCCLTNGGNSYFPTSSAYDEGGYEARTSKLRKGGDDIIVRGVTDLLSKL